MHVGASGALRRVPRRRAPAAHFGIAATEIDERRPSAAAAAATRPRSATKYCCGSRSKRLGLARTWLDSTRLIPWTWSRHWQATSGRALRRRRAREARRHRRRGVRGARLRCGSRSSSCSAQRRAIARGRGRPLGRRAGAVLARVRRRGRGARSGRGARRRRSPPELRSSSTAAASRRACDEPVLARRDPVHVGHAHISTPPTAFVSRADASAARRAARPASGRRQFPARAAGAQRDRRHSRPRRPPCPRRRDYDSVWHGLARSTTPRAWKASGGSVRRWPDATSRAASPRRVRRGGDQADRLALLHGRGEAAGRARADRRDGEPRLHRLRRAAQPARLAARAARPRNRDRALPGAARPL